MGVEEYGFQSLRGLVASDVRDGGNGSGGGGGGELGDAEEVFVGRQRECERGRVSVRATDGRCYSRWAGNLLGCAAATAPS